MKIVVQSTDLHFQFKICKVGMWNWELLRNVCELVVIVQKCCEFLVIIQKCLWSSCHHTEIVVNLLSSCRNVCEVVVIVQKLSWISCPCTEIVVNVFCVNSRTEFLRKIFCVSALGFSTVNSLLLLTVFHIFSELTYPNLYVMENG